MAISIIQHASIAFISDMSCLLIHFLAFTINFTRLKCTNFNQCMRIVDYNIYLLYHMVCCLFVICFIVLVQIQFLHRINAQVLCASLFVPFSTGTWFKVLLLIGHCPSLCTSSEYGFRPVRKLPVTRS